MTDQVQTKRTVSIEHESDYTCPLCESRDNVGGWKVHDGERWWHKCYNSHKEYNGFLPKGYTVNNSALFFTRISDTKTLIEADDGTTICLEWVED